MATTATTSNHYKYQLAKGNIDLSADTLKAILMNTSFVFDKDTHATLASITASQLSTGYGYTQDSHTFTTPALAEDDTNDKAAFTCDDLTITASGGDIGPTGAYCIVDTTTSDDTVICCVDFGTDYTISRGSSIQIQNVAISVA